MHRQKIDMADLVLIVTDKAQYFGDSTMAELEYTKSIGKPYQWIFEGPV